MTPVETFKGKRVALFGLGGSGLSTARALARRRRAGRCLGRWRSRPARRRCAQGIALEDLAAADWRGFDALVLSPGVPLTHPEPHWTVQAAKAAGVEIIGDIELFCREREARAGGSPFVAITGTNGKSTTTALIAHILREAGRDVQLGGNIGVPILDLEPPSDDRIHVIECSSFQIDLAPSLAPTIGVLINITPDHIDRHGTMENYAAIKERLVAARGSRAWSASTTPIAMRSARAWPKPRRPSSVSCRCRRRARSTGDSTSRIAASTSASKGIRLTKPS